MTTVEHQRFLRCLGYNTGGYAIRKLFYPFEFPSLIRSHGITSLKPVVNYPGLVFLVGFRFRLTLIQLYLEFFHGIPAVKLLSPFGSRGHHDTGWNMRKSYGRGGLCDLEWKFYTRQLFKQLYRD